MIDRFDALDPLLTRLCWLGVLLAALYFGGHVAVRLI